MPQKSPKEGNKLNPFILKEKKCPKCDNGIVDEWAFIGECLDNSVVNKESGGLSFEVEAECPSCNNKIFGLLWLVEIYSESRFNKMDKDL